MLVRWASVHWDSLRDHIGFDGDEPPCVTMIGRTLAGYNVKDFQKALGCWLHDDVIESSGGELAVGGKTIKQAIDEPTSLPRKLRYLLSSYSMLRFITRYYS